jgi:hypothetical protein
LVPNELLGRLLREDLDVRVETTFTVAARAVANVERLRRAVRV